MVLSVSCSLKRYLSQHILVLTPLRVKGCKEGLGMPGQMYRLAKAFFASSINYGYIYEPRHEISNNVVCATSKSSDQPAHTRSLIRAFASRLNIL